MDISELRHVRLPELLTIIGIGKSSLYKLISTGIFPQPVAMTERCATWPIVEVRVMLQARAGGRSKQEIVELVKQLMTARKANAEISPAEHERVK